MLPTDDRAMLQLIKNRNHAHSCLFPSVYEFILRMAPIQVHSWAHDTLYQVLITTQGAVLRRSLTRKSLPVLRIREVKGQMHCAWSCYY